MKKWGQAPRVGVILPVVRIERRSQSPFFHKLGANAPGRALAAGRAVVDKSAPRLIPWVNHSPQKSCCRAKTMGIYSASRRSAFDRQLVTEVSKLVTGSFMIS